MGPGGLTLPSGGFARRFCDLPSAIPRRSWVALVEPWWSFGGALVWLWCGLGVALRCLCTPESMPSICLVFGFGVALDGFRWPGTGAVQAVAPRRVRDRRAGGP